MNDLRATLVFAVAAAALAACGGSDTKMLDATVVAGAHAYVNYACAQCHGASGAARTFSLEGGGSSSIPAINAFKAKDAGAITAYLETGKGISMNAPKGEPFMPAWSGVISQADEDALIAYLTAGLPAVDGVAPEMITGTDAASGAKLYKAYACGSCHGTEGQGGVANPGSEDGTIPPLRGMDFRGEFGTSDAIVTMLREGSIIGDPPVVSMPSWNGILTQDQQSALAAYLLSLPASP